MILVPVTAATRQDYSCYSKVLPANWQSAVSPSGQEMRFQFLHCAGVGMTNLSVKQGEGRNSFQKLDHKIRLETELIHEKYISVGLQFQSSFASNWFQLLQRYKVDLMQSLVWGTLMTLNFCRYLNFRYSLTVCQGFRRIKAWVLKMKTISN